MEFVYVVKRATLAPMLPKKGLVAVGPETLERVVEEGFFVERAHAEGDPSLKQIIPYVLLKRQDELFLFQRLKGGGEARLHNLHSVGVGGHINPTEESTKRGLDTLFAGAKRELFEEVGYQGELPLKPFGLLNDDTNEVGSVHVGVVLVLELPTESSLTVRETRVLKGSFRPHGEIQKLRSSVLFETWSELLLDHDLFRGLW